VTPFGVLAAGTALALLFGSILPAKGPDHPISICKIIADPTKYDGKQLLIAGEYRWQPHGAIFYGDNCSKTEIKLDGWSHQRDDGDAKAVWEALVKNDDMQPVHTVYRGRFAIVHGFDCTAVTCFRYKLEDPELVSARP
jgi:hypothetical protein